MSDVKMAVGGSARGQMRPHSSKSPPFLLVGLFVVIAILGFNYWNASTKYAFSRKQVIQLSDKYQELNLKKQGIEKRNLDLVDELNEQKTEVMKCLATKSTDATNCENRIVREKNDVMAELSAIKADADNEKQQSTECQDSLKQCKTGLDAAKEATETAKSEMNTQCEQKVKKAVQDVDVQSLCANVKSSERVNILNIVLQRLGVASLRVLQQSGIDMTGIDMDQVPPSKQLPETYQGEQQQSQVQVGQGQQPQVQLGQSQEPQLGRGQQISPGLQQQQLQPGQQTGQQGQVGQQPPIVGGQQPQQPQQPGQSTQQQPGNNQQQQQQPGQGSQQQPGDNQQKQQPGQGSQQQPGDNQQKQQQPGQGNQQQPGDSQQQQPGQGSQQQPGDTRQQQQQPGQGNQQQPGDKQQQQQQPGDKQQQPGDKQQQSGDKQQQPGDNQQQQPGDNQQQPGDKQQQQQQPDQGEGNSSRAVDLGKAADIGVGVSTVIPSNVSVSSPEGRASEGVMGRGNATGPQMAGLGDSIVVPPGAVARNRSLSAAPSSVNVAISNDTRRMEQNTTLVSTPIPDSQEHAPGTNVDTPGTKDNAPSTNMDDAPGTKVDALGTNKEPALGAGKNEKEVAAYDGGEHGEEEGPAHSLQRSKQEQNGDTLIKKQQIDDGAFRPVAPPRGQEIDMDQTRRGGQ